MLKITDQERIQKLLESDDELPNEYTEDPDIPAYQNDYRFESIQFQWVDGNFSKYYDKNQKSHEPHLFNFVNESVVKEKTKDIRVGEKTQVFVGILKQEDIYCLQCVEPVTSDATLMWFLNFLTYKDLQSNNSFLKSCLVGNIHDKFTFTDDHSDTDVKIYKFDVNIF